MVLFEEIYAAFANHLNEGFSLPVFGVRVLQFWAFNIIAFSGLILAFYILFSRIRYSFKEMFFLSGFFRSFFRRYFRICFYESGCCSLACSANHVHVWNNDDSRIAFIESDREKNSIITASLYSRSCFPICPYCAIFYIPLFSTVRFSVGISIL